MVQRIIHERIVDRVRNGLGSYCMNVCRAKCCRKGKLFLHSSEEVYEVTRGTCLGLIKSKRLKKHKNGIYELELKRGCPSLTKDYKCSIYKSSFRPSLCKDFPVFMRGNRIFIATFCPACAELQKKLKGLKEEGYKIIMQ